MNLKKILYRIAEYLAIFASGMVLDKLFGFNVAIIIVGCLLMAGLTWLIVASLNDRNGSTRT